MDIMSQAERSVRMSRIGAKNTAPEMLVRSYLHAAGLRYFLHAKQLPGKPDLIFPREQIAIFVHGCFWHVHECQLFRWPTSRTTFWKKKLLENRERDKRSEQKLLGSEWTVITVWQCELLPATRSDTLAKLQRRIRQIKLEKNRPRSSRVLQQGQ